MTTYDKRKTFKIYTDGKNFVLSSNLIENEKLLINVSDSILHLNKIINDEWLVIQSKSNRPYVNLIDSFGCLGLLTLESNKKKDHFLLFIKDAVSVNSIEKFDVLRITDVFIVNLNNEINSEDIIQSNILLNNNNSHFVELRKFLGSGFFYFKYTNDLNCQFDLTLNSQLRHQNSQTESRFLWNANLHAPFRRLSVNTNIWLLKIICGCVEIKKVIIGSESYKACIISRLSAERVGTRFNCRGANDYGHCANYVETEQLIFSETEENSLLQVRGSIPLFWEQSGIQVGAHRIKISRSIESSYTAFERHFKQVFKQYSKSCLVLNLLSRKGDEAMLSNHYAKLYRNSSDAIRNSLTYIDFDYHNELKTNKQALVDYLWPKLQDWIRENAQDLTFHAVYTNVNSEADLLGYEKNDDETLNTKSRITSIQHSIIRTNCLDCLDRTNSVQLFLGLELLRLQLRFFSKLNNNEKALQKFREVFRQMWIVNGDNLSKIYAGTGAIQGKSVTQDISRSLTRAIQNNFLDNTKQDAIDMLLYGSLPGSSVKYNDLIERARVYLTNNCLTLPSYLLKTMIKYNSDYLEQTKCRIAIGTWNINGGLSDANMKNLRLSDWLIDAPLNARQNSINGYLDEDFKYDLNKIYRNNNHFIDIFAVGFQEIVDLNAQNIVNASDENAHIWYKKIFEFLCKNGDYMPITYEPLQLVGVCLFVFVHKKHASYIRDVSVARVKTGLGGTAGNKGGVAMRFTYYNSSICFVCSHFAAHQNQIKQRNDDFRQIYESNEFPQSRQIRAHDYIVWFGDLNYRIDMPNDSVRRLISESNWDTLLQAEQLTLQKEQGNVFNEFIEAPLQFPPTYKYNPGEDVYDQSEKNRTPAWTDRVLWSRRRLTKYENDVNFNPGKCLYYGRADIRYSDHRPVLALLEFDINNVIPARLYKTFEYVLDSNGPFQGTVIVTVDNGATVITERLRDAIIKLFCEFNKFYVYREYKNKIYINYHIFQKAFETCKKFNNFHFEEYNCILNVRMERDNFKELAHEELKRLLESHTLLHQHSLNEIETSNLLGDSLIDEQSFIQVPSQLHSNLSISHNLDQLKDIPSSTHLLAEHHNKTFKKSFSNSNMDLIENMGDLSLGQTSKINAIHANQYYSMQPAINQTNFHLFDTPNDDIEFNNGQKFHNLIQPPARPPPPPPTASSFQIASTMPNMPPPLPPSSTSHLIDVPIISINSNSSLNSNQTQSVSPPSTNYELNFFNQSAHFSNSAPKIPPPQHDPFGDINNVTTVSQLLIPVPPVRVKNIPAKDLLLLGDPGTPPPPPPPLPSKPPTSFSSLPYKPNNTTTVRPNTLSLFNTQKQAPPEDYELLGDPGTPPTPPPCAGGPLFY